MWITLNVDYPAQHLTSIKMYLKYNMYICIASSSICSFFPSSCRVFFAPSATFSVWCIFQQSGTNLNHLTLCSLWFFKAISKQIHNERISITITQTILRTSDKLKDSCLSKRNFTTIAIHIQSWHDFVVHKSKINRNTYKHTIVYKHTNSKQIVYKRINTRMAII
jgi:hypothetical protein